MRFYMRLDKGKPKCWIHQKDDETVPESCTRGLGMYHREDRTTQLHSEEYVVKIQHRHRLGSGREKEARYLVKLRREH